MKRFSQSKNDQFYFPSHTLFQLFLEIICHVAAELPPPFKAEQYFIVCTHLLLSLRSSADGPRAAPPLDHSQ